MQKQSFNVADTEAYKAGYNDFMTGQQFANRYMWAMLPHTFNNCSQEATNSPEANNWLDGWNDAACYSAGIERIVKGN